LVGLTKKENTHQGPGSIARPLFLCAGHEGKKDGSLGLWI